MQKEDIYKDEFIKKLLNKVELEEPSADFTKHVMDDVMQDWLTNSVSVKKRMPIKRLLILIALVLLAVVILLGTDVHSIVASWEHPLIKQVNAILIQPIHDLLMGAVDRIVSLPTVVYIIMIGGTSLIVFDNLVKKMLHQS
ncbi:hypothetical protein DWB61_05145 [Ancylomarina euxinus]|uniref:DUF5056 domain-containing protein n=1 Tax=Ancylomarina euxinus TaxID=2283627 RepID=A0A425Y5H8_9BACT|nr:hypothetical protein [Ancylomarina euxinus]MCZ4694203.1 hypothetical protein [Ancylomarina euxinus]MUP14466.1 hypothetical protein [Ancylomarina euxinus]RRG23768.1 hypothetical protein DWB61_05145 [Ancylomarina euxinus]